MVGEEEKVCNLLMRVLYYGEVLLFLAHSVKFLTREVTVCGKLLSL